MLSGGAKARSGRADHIRLVEKIIEELPAGHLIRCLQPDIRGIDTAVCRIAHGLQALLDKPCIAHVAVYHLLHLCLSGIGINGLTCSLHNVGCSVVLRPVAACPESVQRISVVILQILRNDGRAEAKSVISLVDSEVKVEFYVRSVPDVAWQLWECSDEPLTLVLDGARNLASGVIDSDGSVALRVTREAFSRQLCMRMKRAVVSTSANIAGEPAPRCFSEISPEILQAVDYVCLSRRDEAPRQTPYHIIKIGPSGEVKIIR